jgi:hypothetical protein
MADTRPTPISFLRAIGLCLKVLFTPGCMPAEDARDAEDRKRMSQPPPDREHPAYVVRRAFFRSSLLVFAAGSLGYIAGFSMRCVGRCATPATVAWLQIAGACILLWGTLFIRGWEILTYGGVTPTERVNQWLYRALYCVGTAVLVYSLAFPTCEQ